MGVQFCNGCLIQLPLYQTSIPEIILAILVNVSVAQVVKAWASSLSKCNVFERGFNPCRRSIFFQDEGGENREF